MPSARPCAAESVGPGSTQIRILLAEDSQVIRDSLIDLIEADARCQVSCITDTEQQALEALGADRYQVAIIDLQLREGSGLGVLRFLQHTPLPVLRIVLTNFADARMRAQCLALGAEYFLDKSREFDQIPAAIEAYFNGGPDRAHP